MISSKFKLQSSKLSPQDSPEALSLELFYAMNFEPFNFKPELFEP